MAAKRFFFVHLAIFAGLCGTFTFAGISAYKDYLQAEGAVFEARRDSPRSRHARPAPWSLGGVLAFSRTHGTK